MNFNIFIIFMYIVVLMEHKILKGVYGLKHICKLSYINFNGFLHLKSNRCFSKTDESLYDRWGIKPLWNSKPFSLIKLPFNPQSMSPFLSEEAIEYHYSKHHATYVKNLNNLAEQHVEIKNLTLEDIITKYKGSIYNNAAQIFNHNFFWMGLKEEGGGKPYGEIKKKIEESFNSFENFKEIFFKEASGHFGSGWIWLIIKDKKLKIYQGHDADNPIKDDVGNPILTLDIWEHAYYVDYKNSRADYIKEWFNKINWDFANYNLSIVN
ncbi:superoxide dismutase, putative [Plasmodium gallinaceum]|uniref:Superoxide dismutase [Fe] n=1 Tax=Plasmodium gallinaceum TaxID=5849 RepID=A0A1J1GRZ5_PLAGA|nr:superoxide dismutase, putative [Plasmodium gallinaceum]CRG93811.1 superoxide dismutase, putative [Plasmodium gallinaceum]